MLFDQLLSQKMKQGLIAKRQYTLGYNLFTAYNKAEAIKKFEHGIVDFETHRADEKPQDKLRLAKKHFAEFGAYCQTHSFRIAPLKQVIEQNLKTHLTKSQIITNSETNALIAEVTGTFLKDLAASREKKIEVEKAKYQEKAHQFLVEMTDIDVYLDAEGDTIEIEELMPDHWIISKFDECLKSLSYNWEKYGNWDTAELVLIKSDQQLIKSFR